MRFLDQIFSFALFVAVISGIVYLLVYLSENHP